MKPIAEWSARRSGAHMTVTHHAYGETHRITNVKTIGFVLGKLVAIDTNGSQWPLAVDDKAAA